MDQGSAEWHAARLGAVTMSNAKAILVDGKTDANLILKKGGFGTGAETYARQLLSELFSGLPADVATATSLEWGNTYEAMARQELSDAIGMPIATCGFILADWMIGGSPDGLIGDDAICELKCPISMPEQTERILSGRVPLEYVPQIQGNLWVTGRRYCYFASFDPRMQRAARLVVVKVERDEAIIGKLEAKCPLLRDQVLEAYEHVTKREAFDVHPRLAEYLAAKPWERIGQFL